MFRVITGIALLTILAGLVPAVAAQPIVKEPIQVEAGNTKQIGETFGYRLTYTCSSTTGPCLNAEIVDLLPQEVQYVSTVPASASGDATGIQFTPNFGGTGRSRVRFIMINPMPAGTTGDLIINVRFPNGSTPDGATATNTVDAINFESTPGTYTSSPVTVTAVASVGATLEQTLTSEPANLDMPETYRLRISNSNASGTLSLSSIGPVTATLPHGTVFNGATPAADCQPGCIGTTPATVSWTSPCTVPLAPGANCNINFNVTFPSATFPSGTNVTATFTATGTPLGKPSQSLGTGQVTHPVTTFVPNPAAQFAIDVAADSPNPPTLNQQFAHEMTIANTGNVPLSNMVVIQNVPTAMQVTSVTTGAYTGLSDFAVGEGVRVSYAKNTALNVFTLWGSSPNSSTNTTLTAPPPGLGSGEYITRIRWEFGVAQPSMTALTNPRINGAIINPDNAGFPVAFGKTIQTCVSFSATYAATSVDVVLNACDTFDVSAPFVQLNPVKENLSGGGPFNPSQNVTFRLRVRNDGRSSNPTRLQDVVVTDLLPEHLQYLSWTFDDQGTGLPAPQVIETIPNFADSGRTLLRWTWNADSGNLGVGNELRINVTTSVVNGVLAGPLANTFTLNHNNATLGQRCTGTSAPDAVDVDGDTNTTEALCTGTVTITVASLASVNAAKSITTVCGDAVATTGTTVPAGCPVEYSLSFENVGTIALENLTVVDILPFTGDTNVRDANPRGSSWNVVLTEPIIAPPGATVHYSTSGNPCRGEVGGPTTECDPANWTTTPSDPISSVRSIKLTFDDNAIMPYSPITSTMTVRTAPSAPIGTVAYNSFAYRADRADGLGTVAGETPKVALEATTPFDQTPPELQLPDNIVVVTTGNASMVVDFTVTATDNSDPNPTVACIPLSGSLFPVGTTTVTCIATDESLNQSTGAFTVTVQGVSDAFAALRQQIRDTSTSNTIKQHLLFRVWITELVHRINYRPLTCATVNLLDHTINILTRANRIPTSDATLLHTRTTNLRTTLGCGTR